MKAEKRGIRTVLHVRSSGGFLGAESVVIELARNSRTYGYRAVICVPFDLGEPVPELVAVAERHAIRTVTLPCHRPFDLATLRALRRIVAEEACEIVHTHGYREDIYTALALVGKPLVATNHLWKRSNRRLRLYSRLDAFTLRRFDRAVGVSRQIVEEMSAAGVPKERLRYIANGVDGSRFASLSESARDALRAQFGFEKTDCVMAMVGSLTEEKGHRFALQAMARLIERFPHLRLLIVGDGPEEPELRQKAQNLGIASRVCMTGRRSDVPDLLSAIDIFLLPSLAEGLPMAMLEAMASGRAVVASQVGDVGAVIQDDYSGFVISPSDVDALTEALRRLLVEPPLARRLGENGRSRVLSAYSSAVMTEKYCALYDECLEARTTMPLPFRYRKSRGRQ